MSEARQLSTIEKELYDKLMKAVEKSGLSKRDFALKFAQGVRPRSFRDYFSLRRWNVENVERALLAYEQSKIPKGVMCAKAPDPPTPPDHPLKEAQKKLEEALGLLQNFSPENEQNTSEKAEVLAVLIATNLEHPLIKKLTHLTTESFDSIKGEIPSQFLSETVALIVALNCRLAFAIRHKDEKVRGELTQAMSENNQLKQLQAMLELVVSVNPSKRFTIGNIQELFANKGQEK